MSDELLLLWSDEEISNRVEAIQTFCLDTSIDRLKDAVGSAQVEILCMEMRDDYEAALAKLHAAAMPALAWIDAIYPPDIFVGQSDDADSGVIAIVTIRETLRQALTAIQEEGETNDRPRNSASDS